ncbi:hypothetical protein TRIATDRAFT_298811 [Trichoderma atroviride IMI 206040]|uniref:Uncharacterized protein n=1 Tax=Hypocrea atroviridis (strain ATCC 20476 / IMI 206040) TaxID=452589 RepID=G9NQW8_HYPAI|nr:uncharacterized protein TRIATDRAFT_298811 [Trichoderma atroviride IMI 206040]EHK46938.1 hypothetical protein TRIATDRAFT_298811 [Trichoderma atroviride IMI 206040]
MDEIWPGFEHDLDGWGNLSWSALLRTCRCASSQTFELLLSYPADYGRCSLGKGDYIHVSCINAIHVIYTRRGFYVRMLLLMSKFVQSLGRDDCKVLDKTMGDLDAQGRARWTI